MATTVFNISTTLEIEDCAFDEMMDWMDDYDICSSSAVDEYMEGYYPHQDYYLFELAYDNIVEELERRWQNKYGDFKVWG